MGKSVKHRKLVGFVGVVGWGVALPENLAEKEIFFAVLLVSGTRHLVSANRAPPPPLFVQFRRDSRGPTLPACPPRAPRRQAMAVTYLVVRAVWEAQT